MNNVSEIAIILGTSAIRNIFKIEDLADSFISNMRNIKNNVNIYIPYAVLEELRDQCKKGMIDHEKIIWYFLNQEVIVHNINEDLEKWCNDVLKRTNIDIQKLYKTDKHCIYLSLQLSRKKGIKIVFLVTDDLEMYEVSKVIFQKQCIGIVYLTAQFLIFLLTRKLMPFTLSEIYDYILRMYRDYNGEFRDKIEKYLEEISRCLCPYSCRYIINCTVIKQ